MPDASLNSVAALSPSQLDRLALQLTEKRRELAHALPALTQKIVRREDCSLADAAEAASAREEAVRAAGIAAQHKQTIGEIEHALRKLAAGSYGVSEVSGEPIGYQRLVLVPWARAASDE